MSWLAVQELRVKMLTFDHNVKQLLFKVKGKHPNWAYSSCICSFIKLLLFCIHNINCIDEYSNKSFIIVIKISKIEGIQKLPKNVTFYLNHHLWFQVSASCTRSLWKSRRTCSRFCRPCRLTSGSTWPRHTWVCPSYSLFWQGIYSKF